MRTSKGEDAPPTPPPPHPTPGRKMRAEEADGEREVEDATRSQVGYCRSTVCKVLTLTVSRSVSQSSLVKCNTPH